MSKPIALLVRHGEDALSDSGTFVSWTDVPLTEKGQKQAEEAAEFLKQYDIEESYSSTLQRAIGMAHAFGMDYRCERGLLPWNRGILTGCLEEEGKDLLHLLTINPDVHIPFGESRVECETRLEEFFTPRLEAAESKTAVFFTHHSVIDVLNCLLLGKRDEEPENLVKNGGIVAVYADGDSYRMEPVFRADKKPATGMS